MTVSFVPGQPCWFDLSVKDSTTREALMEFFAGVFGWTYDVGAPETGHYTRALCGGLPVCAIGERPEGVGQWVTYLHAPDIEETIGRIGAAGGQVFMGPMQVMDVGTMALVMDPAGAPFGLWQPAEFSGFGVFGTAGAPCWFDHQSPAPARARDFYTTTFGLGFDAVDDQGQGMLAHGSDQLASISMQPEPGMPPSWNPIIAVVSLDETEAIAEGLGTTIMMSRMPVPGGIVSAFATPVTGTPVLAYESVDQPGH